MLKSEEPTNGPSSTIATARPACARISAVTPPPAPLPTTTTSHSISRSRSSAAASMAFQPFASPSLIGSVTAMASLQLRRAGIADPGPRCGVAVPGCLDQLRYGLVAGALDVEAAITPAIEECGDVRGLRLLDRRPQPGEHESRGREAQDREELVDLLLHRCREAGD